jgi:hypothetical protein
MVMISPIGKWESPNELQQFCSGLSRLSDAKLAELGGTLSSMQRDKGVRAVSSRLFPEDLVDRPIPIGIAIDLIRQMEGQRVFEKLMQSHLHVRHGRASMSESCAADARVELRPLSAVEDRIAQLEALVSEWSEDAHNSLEFERFAEGRLFAMAARVASVLRDLSPSEPALAPRDYGLLRREVLAGARSLCNSERYPDVFAVPQEVVDSEAQKLLARLGR